MGSALHRDFTLKNMITPAVLDAQMNLTLSHIAMNVPSCTTFLFLSGDMLQHGASSKSFITRPDHSFVPAKAFILELWYWASLMLLFMPIISIAKASENPGNFGDCMKEGFAL